MLVSWPNDSHLSIDIFALGNQTYPSRLPNASDGVKFHRNIHNDDLRSDLQRFMVPDYIVYDTNFFSGIVLL